MANIDYQIEDGIAFITFGNMVNGNSLPSALLSELTSQINHAGDSGEVKVIVLQSRGEKIFCSGASFDELSSIEDFETGKKFFSGFAKLINAMRKCPKLIISAAQGKAVGGGVGILAASDYVFATHSAAVKLSELLIGLGPFVIGPAVERKIGKPFFTQMSIDCEWYDAEWALDKGLYSEIVPDLESLQSMVKAFAFKLSNLNPEAMKELKKVLWEGTDNWDAELEKRAEISGKLILSDFTKNYIQNFKSEEAAK